MPGTHDRKTLLNEYLESMKERELKKLQQRNEDIKAQKDEIMEVNKTKEEDEAKKLEKKQEKIRQMRENLDLVKAERLVTMQDELDHRMNQKPITYFPYTHGDTVDAARLQIREEM